MLSTKGSRGGRFSAVKRKVLIAAAAIASTVVAGVAHAAMTLTPYAISQGFKLTTFSTGYPTTFDGEHQSNVGPLGLAFTNTGGVLVTDSSGHMRLFAKDIDNQTIADATVTQNYGTTMVSGSPLGNATGLTQIGGHIYMSQQGKGDLVEVSQTGTFGQMIATDMGYATGVVTNPANGHVFVTTLGVGKVFDVNPATKTKTLFTSISADGLTISSDGSTLYALRSDGHVIGYNTATKAQVFDSGFIAGDLDGAALGAGTIKGNLYVNTNDGTLVEVNLVTKAQQLIAAGGSRGDFTQIDLNNGTLLLTQSDSVLRLSGPGGGGFIETPLPAGVWMGGIMGVGGLVYGRKRAGKPA
jgi:hypothetical protein